jgi:hypothetical protein
MIMALGTHEVVAQAGTSFSGYECGPVAPSPCAGQTGQAACDCLHNFIAGTCASESRVNDECDAASTAWNCGCD